MEFRPCIDIHNGKVKQIVGKTLKDENDTARENYISDKGGAYYAGLYQSYGLKGGHVILLNGRDSEYYEATKAEAINALKAYPNGLQVGGGINDENAAEFLDAGASHVIVTSYLMKVDHLSVERMLRLKKEVGREHIVIDLSAQKYEDGYHIMSNRWQHKTEEILDRALLKSLEGYCDEFLIHAVDVEGNAQGIETGLVKALSPYRGNAVTYAGGVHSYEDIRILKETGEGRIHVTVGSALDLFGGNLKTEEILRILTE